MHSHGGVARNPNNITENYYLLRMNLLVVQYQVVRPETISTQATKNGSIASIYIFVHTHNNDIKEAAHLKVWRINKGLKGGCLREAAERK